MVDKGWKFDEIARMTRRQIEEIIFHKRDKKTGAIKIPDEEDDAPAAPPKVWTLADELTAVNQLKEIFGEAIDVDKLKRELEEKYAKKE